jgi:hypothetical protein
MCPNDRNIATRISVAVSAQSQFLNLLSASYYHCPTVRVSDEGHKIIVIIVQLIRPPSNTNIACIPLLCGWLSCDGVRLGRREFFHATQRRPRCTSWGTQGWLTSCMVHTMIVVLVCFVCKHPLAVLFWWHTCPCQVLGVRVVSCRGRVVQADYWPAASNKHWGLIRSQQQAITRSIVRLWHSCAAHCRIQTAYNSTVKKESSFSSCSSSSDLRAVEATYWLLRWVELGRTQFYLTDVGKFTWFAPCNLQRPWELSILALPCCCCCCCVGVGAVVALLRASCIRRWSTRTCG